MGRIRKGKPTPSYMMYKGKVICAEVDRYTFARIRSGKQDALICGNDFFHNIFSVKCMTTKEELVLATVIDTALNTSDIVKLYFRFGLADVKSARKYLRKIKSQDPTPPSTRSRVLFFEILGESHDRKLVARKESHGITFGF